MTENNNIKPKTKAERRERIKARHSGLCANDVEFIPARERISFFEDDSPKRVVIYIRVSTDDEKQLTSFELQKSYYEDFVKNHPNWVLVKIYADEGISGTSLEKRDEFVKMIEDCKNFANKIDLVVVKSVSRFARNLVDCLAHVRELAELRTPIGVYFEIERIYTLNENSEMALIQNASFAEWESRHKSTLLKDAYVKRSKYGIVWVPELLGYDLDENDNLVINEEEAQTVRLIFFMYLYGYTCTEIADQLMELGLRTNGKDKETKEYNLKWSAGSVLQILQNERHCGEVLTQKTWTPNFRSHKSVRNKKDLPQYRKRNHHEPIVSREDFIAVQRLIANAKYKNKGILPQIKVITEGALQGFVSLNPRWAAFSAEDYLAASHSAYGEDEYPGRQTEVEVQSGDFDFRGYQVVRAQFFNTTDKKCLTFTTDRLWFGLECLRALDRTLTVEILINPAEELLAVRPCTKDNRNAVRWAKIEGDRYVPRQIPGVAFLKTLYEIFDWDTDCRYRVLGIRRRKDDEAVLLFDMREIEVLIPAGDNNKRQKDRAFPPSMISGFGTEHYELIQPRETAIIDSGGRWDITADGEPFHDDISAKVTAPDILADNIKIIVNGIEQGDKHGK